MDEINEKLVDALELITKLKPNDRSEIDRRCAIVITDLEKIIAYVYYYIADNE